MALAEHLTELLDGLPRDWSVARVDVTVEDPAEADRAALILSPAMPGRMGSTFTLYVASGSGRAGAPPHRALRVLDRLDQIGIRARLKVGAFDMAMPPPSLAPEKEEGKGLAAAWDELVAKLPADWSDLYLELELDSTDFLERGALLLAPVNPATFGADVGFRFRCAHRFGYGAAPEMARRCLARLDEEGMTGSVRVVQVLSNTKPVATQGPVWRLGGRAV